MIFQVDADPLSPLPFWIRARLFVLVAYGYFFLIAGTETGTTADVDTRPTKPPE